MMRILYISQGPSGPLSGALRSMGHEVILLSASSKGALGDAKLGAKTTLYAARKRPNAAFVELGTESFSAAHALFNLRIPTVLHFGPRLLSELQQRGPTQRTLLETALTSVVMRAKVVVSDAEHCAQFAVDRLGAKEVAVVDSGVEVERALPGDRMEAKRKLELHEDIRLLVMVGALDGLPLDLLAQAHRRMSGVGLLIIGDGPQANFVQAMRAATRPSSPVIFMGPRGEDEVQQAIRAAHVCLSMREDGPGFESILYAAMGRRQLGFSSGPGVSSRSGFSSDSGFSSGSGFSKTDRWSRIEALYPPELFATNLIEERSPVTLRRGLEDVFEHEEKAPLSKEAVSLARTRLSWRFTADQVVQLMGDAS